MPNMNKINVTIESFGNYARLSLERGQNEQAHTMFANLAWTCDTNGTDGINIEKFMAPKKKVDRIIKLYKKMNIPFTFEYVSQKSDRCYDNVDVVPHYYKKPTFESIRLTEEA